MFNSEGLFTASGIFNASAYGVAPALHTYHTEDNIATVSAPDYFPDFFNTDPLDIRVKDILFLECSDFNLIVVIDSLEPVTLTPFINFPTNIVTETTSTQSQTASGVWAAPIAFTLDFVQQGSETLMTFPNLVDVSTGGPSILFDTAIPLANRPAFEQVIPIWILDNSLAEVGVLTLATSGMVTITRANSVAFTATGNAAVVGMAIKYKNV
jgi:hypothetical protein